MVFNTKLTHVKEINLPSDNSVSQINLQFQHACVQALDLKKLHFAAMKKHWIF
jgi:hypothetical protein